MRMVAILAVGTTLAAGAFVAGPAAAEPANPLSLTGPGFSVQFSSAPFAMRVLNASGRTVLAELPDTGGPQLAADVTALFLGGNPSGLPLPHRYAPFTFTVGAGYIAAATSFIWEGDLTGAAHGGVQYAATGVRSARPVPNGLELTLSTNDPSGRTLAVLLTVNSGRLGVAVTPSSTRGVVAMGDSFISNSGEHFAGFGGVHSGLDQHGARFPTWVAEENIDTGALQPITKWLLPGGKHHLFPNGPQAAYYVQPQFVSTAGYGFLLNQPELADWHLDSDRPNAWQVNVAADHLSYEVAVGDPGEVISMLSAATGRHRVPPAWALGAQLDRNNPATAPVGADAYAATIRTDLATIVAENLPITGYRIEAWHILDPTVLRQLISEFAAHGIHVLLYSNGGFLTTAPLGGVNDPAQFDYAVAHNLVATKGNGQPYVFGSPDSPLSRAVVIDFTNPAAVEWFHGLIAALLDTGADGFMSDFGEQVLPDMHFANGQTGAAMHNTYPVLYQQAVRQAVDAYQQTHSGRSIWYFNRAGYTGSTGFEGGNFPGDETTDYSPSSGLQSLTSDMLNRGLAGAYGYSTDVGGYLDLLTPASTKELFIRWAQWAALSPLFRVHNNGLTGTKMPWDFDRQTLDTYRQLAELRQRYQPLIAAAWADATGSGVPLTRPVWLAAPTDPQAWAADQEWLLGPGLLVAPVVTRGAGQRTVYLPPGCWNRQDSPGVYTGPGRVAIAAPLSDLPYFTRCTT